MPPLNGERWFHTLVVIGASLTGCGGKTGSDQSATAVVGGAGDGGAGGGAAGGGGGGATSQVGGSADAPALPGPEMCALAAQFVCDDYETRANCRCDADAPSDPSACQSQFDYTCVAIPCRVTARKACPTPIYVGCRCDPIAPRPTDCPTPEQFFCDRLSPFFMGCACQTPAVDPASCDVYCCESDDPRFGCNCCPRPIR
jgi:hypothetical protein